MTARLAIVSAIALAAAACGSSPKPHLPTLAFADSGAPLRLVDYGVVSERGPVTVRDLAFSSGSNRVRAFLVERGNAHRAGVILVHGSGGDRTELLEYAVRLARAGVAALTLTEPSSTATPPPPTSIRQLLAQARDGQVADVVAVRRAADVLASLAHVTRFGYLGWSAGAKTGTFVAASDKRFVALALLSAGAAPLSAFVANAPPQWRPLVRAQLGLVDPIRYVALARPHTLLLVDGTRDRIVPHAALMNIVRAAPPGTTVRWIHAGHALTPAAFRAAGAWVVSRLTASGRP